MLKRTIVSNTYSAALALLLAASVFHAYEDIPTFIDTNDDLSSLFDENYSDSERMEMTCSPISCTVQPIDILSLILPLGAGTLLQKDVYLHTNPLGFRNLVDIPIFLFQRGYEYPADIGTHLFYEQTSKKQFWKKHDKICSYLAITNQGFLQALANSIDLIEEDMIFDIPPQFNPLNFLPLFKNLSVQERRAGLMLYGTFTRNLFYAFVNVPFYYLERNFFLNEDDQENIELVMGTASSEDTDQFAHEHMISDKIGFGDTRIYFGYEPQCIPWWDFNGGFQVTLPTSFLFSRGMLGSNFNKNLRRPCFDISSFLCPFINGNEQGQLQAVRQAQAFALQALDRLSAMLLESPLGNYRHVGLGLFLKTKFPLRKLIKRPWAHNIYWQSHNSIEYLTPCKERRFFIPACPAAEFEALGLNQTGEALEEYLVELASDPELAEEILLFLQNRIIDIFFPASHKVKVSPGFVYRSSSRFFYEGEHWGFYAGSDWWVQGQDKIRDFNLCGDCAPCLNCKKAKKSFLYQNSGLGGIFYRVIRPELEWTLGLHFEASNSSLTSGVGNNVIVSLTLDSTF